MLPQIGLSADLSLQRSIAIGLCFVSVICYAIGFFFLFSSELAVFAPLAGLAALILGRYGIVNLATLSTIQPLPTRQELAVDYETHLADHFPIEIRLRLDMPFVPEQRRDFNLQVQSALNRYFRQLNRVPDDPYEKLDTYLAQTLAAPAHEFGLIPFRVQTIAINDREAPAAAPRRSGVTLNGS